MHFTPERGWMNDPNGLVQVDGLFHLYFQHDSGSLGPGAVSWGHATSPDLVRWTRQPLAIPCDEREQVFSGCVVVDRPGSLVAIYTSEFRDADRHGGREAQSLAHSADGGLTWTKDARNPVLERPGSQDFRDPKVFRYGDSWVMVTVEAADRQVLIHRSDDLVAWEHVSTFGPANAVDGLWECPDLFELPVDGDPATTRWVLLVSVSSGARGGGSGTQYVVGEFDGVTFRADGRPTAWLDHGRDCYAGVTFHGVADGRRLLVAWMSSWEYARDTPTGSWRGAMTFPRELSLATVGGAVRLVQRLVDLPGATRAPRSRGPVVALGPGAHLLDVDARPGAGPFRLELRSATGEVVALGWADGVLSLDRRASGSLPAPTFASVETADVELVDGVLALTVLVDRCSVEVVAAQGTVVVTDLVFPATPLDRVVLSGDATVTVTSLQPDAVTSPAGPGPAPAGPPGP